MSHRLRHRLTFDPRSLANSLHLRTPLSHPPAQWSWTWPIQATPAPLTPPNHAAWVSTIRAIAVSDDGTTIAFLTHDDGHISIIHPSSQSPIPLPPIEGLSLATSIALFQFSNPKLLLAVGYHSGHVAFYAPPSTQPLFLSRPSQSLPIRRLHYYPAFHVDPTSIPYPTPSPNTGLFAVIGWAGTLARINGNEIEHLIKHPPDPEDRGASWVVWNAAEQNVVLDAAMVGPDPSSICDLDLGPLAPHRVLLAGANPALAAFAITSDRAFSARDVAKRAANSVLSAARGFLWSRGAPVDKPPAEEERSAVMGVARLSTAWADGGTAGTGLISFGDVRTSARKSVSAVLARGMRQIDVDAVAVEGRRRSLGNVEDQAANGENFIDSMFTRQRSRFSGEEVTQAAKLPQNSRVVERVMAAPLPCSLVATADTLGRVFVMDSRDLCILKVMKGYRDANIAWLKEGGPVLAVLSPRLNVLELHDPLKLKRSAAFKLMKGSMLVQSTGHHVFCLTPEGMMYELTRARKGQQEPKRAKSKSEDLQGVHPSGEDPRNPRLQNSTLNYEDDNENEQGELRSLSSDYELVHAFIEAVKRGQTSKAVECLHSVHQDPRRVAHLMANLVTCTAYIRTEMHVALASKAAQIVSNLGNGDLVSRFEAHGRLAEAFALLASEYIPGDIGAEQERISKYGHRLFEDELGAGLVQFAVSENPKRLARKRDGKRMRDDADEEKVVNCECFILSHALEPTNDLRAKIDFVLRPRRDLSVSEQHWLAKVYFTRLLEVDSTDLPTEGREHPTTKDVFLALTDFVGLSEEDFTRQFVTFFLNSPLSPLLHTHVSLYASPLRCTIGRLRNLFDRDAVDQVIVEMSENSPQIPNAVLLVRLFAFHDRRRSMMNDDTRLSRCLEKLEIALQFRKHISGSAIPKDTYEKYTANGFKGMPGDAERYAVACLIEWNEFERASQILMALEQSWKRRNAEWCESAAVSESALHACRKKAVVLMTDSAKKVIPGNVVSWILFAGVGEKQPQWEDLLTSAKDKALRDLRAVLLSAHQYFPDSSVDAVRCLQLAEAMSALIELGLRTPKGSPQGQKAPELGKEILNTTRDDATRLDADCPSAKSSPKAGNKAEPILASVEPHPSNFSVPTMSDDAEAPSLALDVMDIVNSEDGKPGKSEDVSDEEFYDAPPDLDEKMGEDQMQEGSIT